jgi:hypothetical protein
LFGNPEKTQGRLSPDGKYVSFIAPRDGVLNIWLAERGKLDAAKPSPTIRSAASASTSGRTTTSTCCSSRTKVGTRTSTCMPSTSSAGTQKDLTPYKGVRAEITGISWKKPGVIAVGLNDRAPEWHDL